MGIKKQRLSMMLLKIRDQENAAIVRATIRSFFFGVVVKALESWLGKALAMKRKVAQQIAAREAAELRQLQRDAMEVLNQMKKANEAASARKSSLGARRASTSKE